MSDLVKSFKEVSFQINPHVLKNIKSLNLNMNEFLLLIYFLNKEPFLDLENIKNTISFTDEEVLNTYSELLSKGIIETKVINENGKINEIISLELLYDKLVLNNKEEKNKDTDIFYMFESELGRSLSSVEYETISNWIDSGISEELILKALKEAILNGASNIRYIEKILYEWTKKDKKIDDEVENIFDYDWLGVSNER